MASGGPKAPSVEALEKLVARLDEIINSGDSLAVVGDGENAEVGELWNEPDVVVMRDALDWTLTYLGNRRDYHKRRNVKTKVEMELFRERLEAAGVDVKKLEKEASEAADDSIT
jgi:deoxyribodipyrimidine photolyase-like uncharacterized protein